MAAHVLWMAGADLSGERLVVTGEEARHALRVKRVREGEEVLCLTGAGLTARAVVERAWRDLELRIVSRGEAPRVGPFVDVWAPAPKGPRAADMVDMLTQVGAGAWTPMRTERTEQDVSAARESRLERVAAEACKQSQRAWAMELRPAGRFDEALAGESGGGAPDGAGVVVLADASGEAFLHAARGVPAPEGVRLLIGPEGGFTPGEVEAARAAGAMVASFGPHVMRVEGAAAVAAAQVIAAWGGGSR